MSIVPKTNTYVDHEISRTVLRLQDLEPDSDEYGALLERLSKLQKIRQEEKPDRPKLDTILTVTANLIGVTLILMVEHEHVITSKAMNFVMKPKTY